MFYLIATVLLNSVLYLIFKLFQKFEINNLQAIVFNYWTCVVTGSIFFGSFPVGAGSMSEQWLPWALLSGVGFITIFNLLGYCTLKDGITTASVANKISLVIPVLFSVLLYHEGSNWVKVVGILLAFPAVYFTTRVREEGGKKQELLWPALLFIGSGLLDTLVKYVEQRFLWDAGITSVFTIHVFVVAGSIGFIVVGISIMFGKAKLQFKNLVAGIILGVPNYFSIYFFIRFLNSGVMQSSAAIPVNNISIVMVSAIVAMLFFKEKPERYRIIGLLLSVISIVLIAFADSNGRGI
jgi:drug/metabolite transporter (DMT)-like permease